MAVVQMAMLAGLPYLALRDAILTHPTMAEGLNFFQQRYMRNAEGRRVPAAPFYPCRRGTPGVAVRDLLRHGVFHNQRLIITP